ncbi:MAG: hypothetical protein H0X67_01475 [Acidobacteria bacterium]|nr:hypothetical protein [Acidobacteriota bacterium]
MRTCGGGFGAREDSCRRAGGATFTSDTARDGLGYPNTWRSYHPALVDTARPNLMDN